MNSKAPRLGSIAAGFLGVDRPSESDGKAWKAYLDSRSQPQRQAALETLRGEELIELFVSRMSEGEDAALDALLAVHEAAVLAWLLGDEHTMTAWLQRFAEAARLAPPGWAVSESVASLLAARADLPLSAQRAWAAAAKAFAVATQTATPPVHGEASTLASRVMNALKPKDAAADAWSLAARLARTPRKSNQRTKAALVWGRDFQRPAYATLSSGAVRADKNIRTPDSPPPMGSRVFMVSNDHRNGADIGPAIHEAGQVVWSIDDGGTQVLVVIILHTDLPPNASLSQLLADKATEAVAVQVVGAGEGK